MRSHEITSYKPMFDQVLYQRRKHYLKEFIFNDDKKIRSLISQLLPNEIEVYDKRLIELFKLYKITKE